MIVLNFNYWTLYRDFSTFAEIKEYINDLEIGLIKEPIYRENLNNGLLEKYNPKTTSWEIWEVK